MRLAGDEFRRCAGAVGAQCGLDEHCAGSGTRNGAAEQVGEAFAYNCRLFGVDVADSRHLCAARGAGVAIDGIGRFNLQRAKFGSVEVNGFYVAV